MSSTTYHLVLEALKKKGELTDSELLKVLKEANKHVTMRELYDALMRLEVKGVVYVSSLAKKGKMVRLVSRSGGGL